MERASARSVWRHSRELLRPVRRHYVAAATAVVISTLITLSGPALVRYAVDAGIRKGTYGPLNTAALIFLGLALAKPFVVRAQTLSAASAARPASRSSRSGRTSTGSRSARSGRPPGDRRGP